MRAQLSQWIDEYPKAPRPRDPAFHGSALHGLVGKDLPAAFRSAMPELSGQMILKGGIGKGGWTHTSWFAFLDPTETTKVEEGIYAVYLLSHGGERLYLTLNQGCTTLKEAVGIPAARLALRQRAELIWQRVSASAKQLQPLDVDLGVAPSVWRGKLYELGAIAGRAYTAANLPSDETLVEHLREALHLYQVALTAGGWQADDTILQAALEDEIATPGLAQAKKYRQHRSIERQASHSKKVKDAQGYRCKACSQQMAEIYGDVAKDLIDAHHLTPLHSLVEGAVVTFDPMKDFAVLCPNCHRTIHRMPDPSDVGALRALLASRHGQGT